MKHYFLLLVIILVTSTCNKDDEIRFVDSYSTEISYTIEYFSDLSISKIEKFRENKLEQIISYDYTENTVIKKIKDSNGEIRSVSYYYLGDNNFAINSVDSTYGSSGLTVAKVEYFYNAENYLQKSVTSWKTYKIESGIDSASYTQEFKYGNNNLESITIFECTDYFQYTDNLQKIDLY